MRFLLAVYVHTNIPRRSPYTKRRIARCVALRSLMFWRAEKPPRSLPFTFTIFDKSTPRFSNTSSIPESSQGICDMYTDIRTLWEQRSLPTRRMVGRPRKIHFYVGWSAHVRMWRIVDHRLSRFSSWPCRKLSRIRCSPGFGDRISIRIEDLSQLPRKNLILLRVFVLPFLSRRFFQPAEASSAKLSPASICIRGVYHVTTSSPGSTFEQMSAGMPTAANVRGPVGGRAIWDAKRDAGAKLRPGSISNPDSRDTSLCK